MLKILPLVVLVAFALGGLTFSHATAQTPTPTAPLCEDAPPEAAVCIQVVRDFGPYGGPPETSSNSSRTFLRLGVATIVVGTAALLLTLHLRSPL